MPKYEVVIYNEEVRDAIKMGDKHERYEDSWADTHYIDVLAPGEEIARAKIEKQYPAKKGFVIVEITRNMPDGEF